MLTFEFWCACFADVDVRSYFARSTYRTRNTQEHISIVEVLAFVSLPERGRDKCVHIKMAERRVIFGGQCKVVS
jgi:hypothetical protein